MEAKTNSVALVETLGIRVTAAERKAFELRAEKDGLSLSEWCRRALFASAKVSTETRLLLSEIIAARRMITSIQITVAAGKPLDDKTLKDGAKHVDSLKLSLADERIADYFAKTATEAEDEDEERENSEDEETDETEEDATA